MIIPLARGLLVLGFAAAQPVPAKIPVILDTDIGSDIDDTWAIAHLLRSPELDVKLILTGTGDTRYRTELAAKLLEAGGRTDVPLGVGHHFGRMPDEHRHQNPWLKNYDIARYPGVVHEDGIGAMIDIVMTSETPVTVIAIGPVPNLAKALEREPRIAARCRFVGMHGSFYKGYGDGPPVAEANVRGDVNALRKTLGAGWRDVLLTPLDTCGQVELRGELYKPIWAATGDGLLRAVIENYCIWVPRVPWLHCDFFAQRSTTLFDCVAVYLAYAEELLEIETMKFDITDEGFTLPAANGKYSARVALRWRDRDAFENHLSARLQRGCP